MKSRKFHVCVPPLSRACKIIASNTTVVCSKDTEFLTVSGLFFYYCLTTICCHRCFPSPASWMTESLVYSYAWNSEFLAHISCYNGQVFHSYTLSSKYSEKFSSWLNVSSCRMVCSENQPLFQEAEVLFRCTQNFKTL